MEKAIIYIHGQGGNAEEAKHYQSLLKQYDVIGFDYHAQTPWEASDEFPKFFDTVSGLYQSVTVIANSIGAYFTMAALADRKIEKAFFISPVVDMQKMFENMMSRANVSEDTLRTMGKIETSFGQELSWDYLAYVKEHAINWAVPTHILYGGKDNLTSFETISDFAERIKATLTIMENGEHWFHTDEQMRFLDDWLKNEADLKNIIR